MEKVTLYSRKDIANLTLCGQIHKEVQLACLEKIKVGATSNELDKVAQDILKKNKAKSPFFKFNSYPKHICVSVNEEILHGIPSDRKFKHLDLITIDIGVKFNNIITDGAFTIIVSEKGKVQEAKNSPEYNLLLSTYNALRKSISEITIENYAGDFCKIFDKEIKNTSYFLITEFQGHGVGRSLHEEPRIPNSPINKNFINWKLQENMIIAIEPMITSKKTSLITAKDGWTIKSSMKDVFSAHFEETVYVTKDMGLVPVNRIDVFEKQGLVKE